MPDLKKPKIFVGTLESGETEFTDCAKAIQNQSGVTVNHQVVSGLPEGEAHSRLWERWNTAKKSHDLFVKVDADTVLVDDGALLRVWKLFESDPEVTGVQIYLQDYFSDSFIAGLSAFSPDVLFTPSNDPLKPDHADTGHKKVLKPESLLNLAPIGFHAPRPGFEQSLFYGYHRFLKGQYPILLKVMEAYKVEKDEPRRNALLGASLALRDHKRGRFWRKISKRLNLQNKLLKKSALRETALEWLKKTTFDREFANSLIQLEKYTVDKVVI